MYNYTALSPISEEISEIISAFPANESVCCKKEIYNDLNVDNMFAVSESSIDDNTGRMRLADKMYREICSQRDINLGNIPLSKGDVTRLKQYDIMKIAMNTIYQCNDTFDMSARLNSTPPNKGKNDIDRMTKIHEILINYKNDFTMGFKLNNELIMHTYCLLISSLIDMILLNLVNITSVIEDNNNATIIQIKVNHEKLGSIRAIDKVLNSFDNGTWAKFISTIKRNIGRHFSGVAIMTTIGWTAVGIIALISLLYAIRALIALYYNSAVSINDKCNYMSQYIEEYARIENDPVAKEKQEKMSNKLKSISSFITTKILKEDARANQDLAESNRALFTKNDDGTPIISNSDLGDIVFE